MFKISSRSVALLDEVTEDFDEALNVNDIFLAYTFVGLDSASTGSSYFTREKEALIL